MRPPGTRREVYRVFLSYSLADRPITSRLIESLHRQGVDTFWAEDLHAGSDWSDDISQALGGADAVVVVVTPNSLSSEFVTRQWSAALSSSRRVIPVLAGGAGSEDLPRELAQIQAVDLNADFEGGVEAIVQAVRELRSSDEPSPSEFVDVRSIVEEIVDSKLVSLGVDRVASKEPLDEEDPLLVFVVASFQPDMQPAFEAIDAAAQAVGLRAERVKDVPGDYRITDRILSSIRRAGLIVVDLTHERPNVYFELGFARGLGKTVITIVREGTKPHFDVQDWTYLPYVDSRPLEQDLVDRFKYELEHRGKEGGPLDSQGSVRTSATDDR